jgi:hypothetical protein
LRANFPLTQVTGKNQDIVNLMTESKSLWSKRKSEKSCDRDT